MYLNLEKIIKDFNLNIRGSIHIGAHKGEEIFSYYRNNIKNIILIEANQNLIKYLKIKKTFYNFLFKMKIDVLNFAAFSSENKELTFNVTNNSQSSSILDLKLHKSLYPSIYVKKKITVKTQTLNKLFENNFDIKNFNFINMDIQGSELEALKGADKILKKIDAIYTEINFDELYEGCVQAKELDIFLDAHNFKRVITVTPEHDTWGDALYIKK